MKISKKNLRNLVGIKNRRDFLHVQKHQRKCVRPGFVLQSAATPATNHGETDDTTGDTTAYIDVRYGLTVSGRVDKRAVIRNRIKRRLRSLAADILACEAAPGYDYVLIGRKQAYDRSYDELKRDLRSCLKKMDLMKQDLEQ